MLFLLKIIVIALTFISLEHETHAYTSVVFPIHKHTDASQPLYSVEAMTEYVNMEYKTQNLLIDLDSTLIWRTCLLQWNMYQGSCPPDRECAFPVSCEEYQCTDVRESFSYKLPYCQRERNSSTLPGWGVCTCPVNVVNPIDKSCLQAQLNYDTFTAHESNGVNIYTGIYSAYPNAACADDSAVQSFPANVTGVMAFSTSPYALPANLVDPLKRVVGMCLPNTLAKPGVLVYGDTSYNLLPQPTVDVRSYLSYTPLIKHPDSFGYFIGVNNIVIKKRSITVPADAVTKISTIEPYTILRTDIYTPVARRFSMVTKRLPPAKAVAPFGLCFSAKAGVRVPDIDFGLPDGKKWTMSTANSIKQVTPDVACLAFVDGGATSQPAIVIGTFQMEDNFVVFNLENSSFGFSSSLLPKKTSCSNFNYTLVSNY